MLLIDPSKKYYKGCTHMHTTNSDGAKSPADAAKVYEELGFDFIFVTDHWNIGYEFSCGKTRVFRGVEYDFRVDDPALHIVALLPGRGNPGVRREENMGLDKAMEAVERINACGGCAIFAHPAWSLNDPSTIFSAEGVAGVEIFNAVSGMPYGNDRSYSGSQIDIAASKGAVLPLLCGDDVHYYKGEAGMGANYVQADELTAESVIDAIRRGRVFSTQGPVFNRAEYDEEKRELVIDCSPVNRIVTYSNLAWVPNRCTQGDGFTHLVIPVRENETFFRVEIIDNEGKRGFLSPFRTRIAEN